MVERSTAVTMGVIVLVAILSIGLVGGVASAQENGTSDDGNATDPGDGNASDPGDGGPDDFEESTSLLEDRLEGILTGLLTVALMIGVAMWGVGSSTKYSRLGIRIAAGSSVAIVVIYGRKVVIGFMKDIAPSMIVPVIAVFCVTTTPIWGYITNSSDE